MLKVLKYDWRSGWNNVRFTIIAAVILSVLLGILVGITGGAVVVDEANFAVVNESDNMIVIILSIVWAAVMIALAVLTLSAIARNMISRMFGAEAYLTHTLPVKTWQLLLGKALGTWLFGVFMVVVAVVCFVLMLFAAAAGTGYMGDVIAALVAVMPKLGAYHFGQIMSGIGYLIYGIAAFLAWSFLIIVQFQFICIAARQFGKYHVAGGIIVFVVLARIESIFNNSLSLGFVVFLLFSAACFFGSRWLLKNRLSI